MKLYEFEGKKYLKDSGILTPKSLLITSLKQTSDLPFKDCIIKAQVLRGKRKKSGLIKISKSEKQTRLLTKQLLKKTPFVLIEEKIKIKSEIYLSLMINPFEKNILVIYSKEGGIDIEELSKKDPGKIKRFPYQDNLPYLKKHLPANIAVFTKKLYKTMKKLDAELIEINPLALTTKDHLIALDCKTTVNEDSLFRHPELEKLSGRELTKIEKLAHKNNLHYVDLDGEAGFICDGAGLVMTSIDLAGDKGITPAFFLDVGGGAGRKRAVSALKLAIKKNPKALLINIFGGITKCEDIASAIISLKLKIKFPIIARMAGTNEKEAQEILKKNKIKVVYTLEEGIGELKNVLK